MSSKSDVKHLLVNTIQGGKHTIEIALNFDVKKIKWLQKSLGGFNIDFLFKSAVDYKDEKKQTHTKWGVCFVCKFGKQQAEAAFFDYLCSLERNVFNNNKNC